MTEIEQLQAEIVRLKAERAGDQQRLFHYENAAAQVGETDLSGKTFTKWAWREKPEIAATLTPGMLSLIEADRRNTIERCAQVADGFMDINDAPTIAAAIRKLKDGP